MSVNQIVRLREYLAGIDLSLPNLPAKIAPRTDTALVRATRRPSSQLNMVDLVSLYRSVEEGIGHKLGAIVQLVTPSGQEHCVETAYGLAWAGASLVGKRVLFVDATGTSHASLSAQARPGSSGMERRAGAEIEVTRPGTDGAVSTKLESGFFIASLPYDQTGGDVTDYPQMKSYLQELRPIFDLIVIATPPALDSALAATVSGFADGSILLLEAGRSRYGKAARAIDVLTSGGAPFIGVVLAKRPSPIPRWLRRWFGAD